MNSWTRSIVAASLCAAPLVALPTAAAAGVGDLLVAPTRLVLDGHKGAEVILNNIGDQPATYRISVEFRRMTQDGDLVDVPATTVAQPAGDQTKGVQFKLTPVYGVTIPVIVRLGNLQAAAGIANVHLEKKGNESAVGFDITRTGTRSTYGEVRVLKAGLKDP